MEVGVRRRDRTYVLAAIEPASCILAVVVQPDGDHAAPVVRRQQVVLIPREQAALHLVAVDPLPLQRDEFAFSALEELNEPDRTGFGEQPGDLRGAVRKGDRPILDVDALLDARTLP